jgi:lysine 2,3-aminomutase
MEGTSFSIEEADFDASLLPEGSRTPGTEAFHRAVSDHFQRSHAAMGSQLSVVFSAGRIEVSWDIACSHSSSQPIELQEPDWKRLPGYREVSHQDWMNAHWQRAHSVRSLPELKRVFGSLIPDSLLDDIERDQRERATMSMLIPPHMLNTMDISNILTDPVRRYMLPCFSDRHPEWPSHPFSSRDSLHERDMWPVEGLIHRYPSKVLAELTATCPQYCGHCTRMDLVGSDTTQILKYRFKSKLDDRWEATINYLQKNPQVGDIVLSGGDIANVPIGVLESRVMSLLKLDTIRDIRIASKSLIGLPQYFMLSAVRKALERIGDSAKSSGVSISLHTHANAAQQITPLVAKASQIILESGFRDVRNQGVLLRGVNTTSNQILSLCRKLHRECRITPYYFYLCDMIPNGEHWRISLSHAKKLQESLLGYLPGYATPRLVCDVPFVGKRFVHMAAQYDGVRGVSLWAKQYRTPIENEISDIEGKMYPYYDPIDTLPLEGKDFWRNIAGQDELAGAS